MTKKEKLIIEGTDSRWLTRDQLSGLTRAQLSGLTRDQLSRLTRDQLSGLTGVQLSWLTRDQLFGLTGDQLSGLTCDQLSGLTRAQLSGLTRAQLSWLTHVQLVFLGLKNVPILEKPYTKILAAVKKGSLEMNSWHTCETTHCVGGWIIQLTPEGKELEAKVGTRVAAEYILRVSRPDAPLPNFTASNEAAMAFIVQRASEEN